MDYEKKYKEALELARDYYKANLKLHKADENAILEDIFHELNENEDEKNIKGLIDELKCSLRAANCQNDACGGGHEKRIALLEWGLAWLEKQGNKPFNYENANIQQKDFAPKSHRMVSAWAKEALYSKPVWSEKDEKMYLSIMSVLLSTIGTDKNGFTVTREVDWLKSLKDRYTWKPSDEQIEVLEALVEDNNQRYFYLTLNSLYEQLKKLREE